MMCYESVDAVGSSQIMLLCAVAYWSVGPVYCYVIGGVCLLVPLLLLTNVKQHAMSWDASNKVAATSHKLQAAIPHCLLIWHYATVDIYEALWAKRSIKFFGYDPQISHNTPL